MSDPPSSFAEFREPHVLRDGTRVIVRAIRPDDAAELRRSFERLSPRSRYQRFLGGVGELNDALLAYLTDVDGTDHVAIVCTTETHDLKAEVGLGVARFVRLPEDPKVAEAAITVLDEAQGRGIGRLLLRALASLAVARGIRVFRGEVLADNVGMRHLLEEASAETRAVESVTDESGGLHAVPTLIFDVPLQEPLGELDREPRHPLRRLLRIIARELRRLPHPPAVP